MLNPAMADRLRIEIESMDYFICIAHSRGKLDQITEFALDFAMQIEKPIMFISWPDNGPPSDLMDYHKYMGKINTSFKGDGERVGRLFEEIVAEWNKRCQENIQK